MIIKKFQGKTETEAIMHAKEELGKDAIVMNMKTIVPKGIYKLFRKTVVEITAAIDENKNSLDEKAPVSFATNKMGNVSEQDAFPSVHGVENLNRDSNDFNQGFYSVASQKNTIASVTPPEESAIEKKLNSLQELLEQQLKEKEQNQNEEKQVDLSKEIPKNMEYIRLVYKQLISNEVEEKYANQIMYEIDHKVKTDVTVDNILAAVYQKIVLKIGEQKKIECGEGKTKFVFFIGPTGVGKTTTIAKIASDFLIHKKLKVGLLTADTYRVAAVEQLRTYANILGAPLKVIYSVEEMEDMVKEFEGYDVILIDTAGRSHRNQEQKDDISRLIETIPKEDRDVFLVLSATTKYRDLEKITQVYHEFTDYGLIFTKLDETSCIGNILNVRMLTQAPLSYATFGQNVPDDISLINPQSIAKQLLGGCD